MKRIIVFIYTFVFGFSVFASTFVGAAQKNTQTIKVYLNGEQIEFNSQQPTVVDRRTLIPLRGIFEKMGYNVTWDSSTKSCTIFNSTQKITMRSGHKGMQVDDRAYMLDVPAQIINKSLMIPLRAVAECTGATVTWDSTTKSIYINSNVKEQVTYSVADYVKSYTEAVADIENAEPLFDTLNSLTDSNYSKNVDILKKECEKAKISLNEAYVKLTAITPPDDYNEFHQLSINAINTSLELCNLVNSMINGDLSYEEASKEIEVLENKAKIINKDLNNTTLKMNLSLYR
ncbi:MAG: copper amine oxidase N-terminal domain-containing protein [Anaerotignaceae bacterium]